MTEEAPDVQDVEEYWEDPEMEHELWFGPADAPFRFEGES